MDTVIDGVKNKVASKHLMASRRVQDLINQKTVEFMLYLTGPLSIGTLNCRPIHDLVHAAYYLAWTRIDSEDVFAHWRYPLGFLRGEDVWRNDPHDPIVVLFREAILLHRTKEVLG